MPISAPLFRTTKKCHSIAWRAIHCISLFTAWSSLITSNTKKSKKIFAWHFFLVAQWDAWYEKEDSKELWNYSNYGFSTITNLTKLTTILGIFSYLPYSLCVFLHFCVCIKPQTINKAITIIIHQQENYKTPFHSLWA